MSSRKIAFIAIILSSLFWSTAGVSTKLILRVYDPIPGAFIRFFLASLILLPFFLFKERKNNFWQMIKDISPIALFSTANILFYYFGIKHTTVNAATIMYSAVPLIIALLTNKLLGEHISKNKYLGIILGFVGVVLITILPLINSNNAFNGNITGNIIIVCGVLSWSFYAIGSRKLLNINKYSSLSVTFFSLLTSTIVLALLTLTTNSTNLLTPLLEWKNLILMLHLSILVTIATYLLYQWAIQHSSAATASLNNYLQPLLSVILAIIFLGEKLTWGYVIGSILVIAGILLAEKEIIRELINRTKRF